MGIGIMRSGCKCCVSSAPSEPANTTRSEPTSTTRFHVLRVVEVGDYCAAIVKYDGFTNYEGVKVLVYETDSQTLLRQRFLDPHFCDKGHLSPFARFRPTAEGWQAACNLLRLMLVSASLVGNQKD